MTNEKVIGDGGQEEIVAQVRAQIDAEKSWEQGQIRKLMFAIFALLGLMFVSVTGNILQFVLAPQPRVFGVTPDLRVVEAPLLSEPTLSEAGLRNWAEKVVVETGTFGFRDYRMRMLAVQDYYFRNAFVELVTSMKDTRAFVETKKLFLSTTVDGAARITGASHLDGAAAWGIEIPVRFAYESSNGVERTQNLLAVMIIQRVEIAEAPNGVKVRMLTFKPR